MKKIIVLLILLLGSCKTDIKETVEIKDSIGNLNSVVETSGSISKNVKDSTEKIANASTIIAKNANDTTTSAEKIKVEGNNINKNADEISSKSSNDVSNQVANIKDSVKVIKSESDLIIELQLIIKNQVNELDESNKLLMSSLNIIETQRAQVISTIEKLTTVQSLVAKLENDIKARDETIKTLNSEAEKSLKSKLMWMVIIGIIGIGICLASAINGNTQAWAWSIVGVCIVICSITVMHFFAHLAWIGLVAVVIIIVLIAFKVKRDVDYQKINTELVQTGEILKDALPAAKRTEIFGHGAYQGVLGSVQSAITKKKVHDIRKRKRDVWGPTIDTGK